ncbi:AAA family ATPase [Chryseobacterium caseinilyticum]|uniref:ATP-binding protein n=1 Tax=Chryseobacterium caseinilyticum TaxID=2771428 RepID=A0ABR8ZEZ3_9FLAO|nr:AAA family ATPase [Chryseobacterium caseinilyticum]MBD8083867.1 ATP-binding protein [Chryseobacterium caseinilyticum]
MNIKSFKVFKLFGKKNFNLHFEDNKLIIVAENGSGKTILLRLFFLFFSKQWNELVKYEFEEITALVNDKEFSFKKSEYRSTEIPNYVIEKLSNLFPTYKDFIRKGLINYKVEQIMNDEFLLGDIEAKYDVPQSLILSILNEVSSNNIVDNKYDWLGSFLYLPTYRRIERSYLDLYGDMAKRLEQHLRQLLPEIDLKINDEKISNNSSFSETENDLQKVFDTIWSNRDYERWAFRKEYFSMELVEFDMVDIEYRISKLLEDKTFSSSELFQRFIEKSNKYLSNNKMVILSKDGKSIRISIDNKTLPLTVLSAGEKHIISLFSYLLYSPQNVWLIIDEPEISLSMGWQENLINDIIDFHIDGIVAATHSPFIVPENFNNYTHGLNEFKEIL